MVPSDGSNALSIKEAVRIAQSNNFMGLVCRSRILDAVPALVTSIKVAGLVLVSDASLESGKRNRGLPATASSGIAEGIDGVLRSDGVMKFNETLDV